MRGGKDELGLRQESNKIWRSEEEGMEERENVK